MSPWRPHLLGLVAGVFTWRSDSATKGWEADGGTVKCQRIQSSSQRTAVPWWREGVSFHTSLLEDRCKRLLVKNLGRGVPESVFREELESLEIRVQRFTKLDSGRRDQDPAKDQPLTPHFIVSVAWGPMVSKVRWITELCGLRVSVESCVSPKGPLRCKRCQRFGYT